MKYKFLGNSDLKVSTYCLGTMTFGETTSEEDGHYQLDESLAFGINFIDTAEMYPTCPLRPETTGDTEIIVGNWITKNKSKRSSIVLATKVSGKGYMAVRNGEGINAKSVKIAIEGSLKKLQTDYIDLYQLHWPIGDLIILDKIGIMIQPNKIMKRLRKSSRCNKFFI